MKSGSIFQPESFSPSALTERIIQYLNRAKSDTHHAFLELFEEDMQIMVRQPEFIPSGPLRGLVLGIKDVICYENHRLGGSSKILEGFVSQFTATALQRLLNAGAVVIGRQNCDEFAMGSSNENSAYGPVRNAQFPDRVPGGSSGGSAVAVQAGLCDVSLASDTGGSIRQPAAFCGLVGLKPTYSRVSRYGLIGYGSSFDCIGPLTRDVQTAARILEVMAGHDPLDATSSRKPVDPYTQAHPNGGAKKIAYWRSGLESESIQPEIREAMQHFLDECRRQGHQTMAIDLPYMDYILPTYYILTTAEASSNLARYDGMHFGYRTPEIGNLENTYKKTRTEGFGKEVRRRILLGTFVLSSAYQDAYFTRAQKVRRLIYQSAETVFREHDFLLMPTSPTTPFKLGERTRDPMAMYLADAFTVWANLAGVPAISLPYGQDKEGLPIGLQLHAGLFEDWKLLDFARKMEIPAHG